MERHNIPAPARARNENCSIKGSDDLYSLRYTKTMMVNRSKMIFFQKVCQLVSTIASPKQPQSLTGFVSANTRVSGVKKAMNNKEPHAKRDTHKLNNKAIPIRNSARESAKEKNNVVAFIQPMPKALK